MKVPDSEPDSPRDAFSHMVAEHYDSIRQLVFRLLGWRDGEDVVQEVFLSAWAAWRRFPGPVRAGFWLMRIAVNKCRSHQRREAVRARWLRWMRASSVERTQAAADDPLCSKERACRVRRAIQSLDHRHREVTVLHYLEQMSVDEIAKVVGARRNTVDVRLHRARRQLEQVLADLME